MADHKPTAHLRLVTTTPAALQANQCGAVLGGGYCPPKLQQLWESQTVGVEDEWRDVPVIVEAAYFVRRRKGIARWLR